MSRTKLKDRVLPRYTRGEEIFNMTSHIVGVPLGIIALVMCVAFATKHDNVYGIVSGSIYGVSMIILYTMSSIYHGLSPKLNSKKVFQIFDHCAIFLLIAGCYTPVALSAIRPVDEVSAWIIFGVIWFIAILGIVLNAIDLKKFKVFSMICYLIMGWCIVFRINLLPKVFPTAGIVLLALGGIAYSVGAVLYGMGKKHKYIHSVFHLFILLGSLLQFFAILLYTM